VAAKAVYFGVSYRCFLPIQRL